MMIEISHALELYIQTYSDSTAQLNAMAGALFAGAAFLTVRAAGVIKDDAVPPLKWQWLLVGVMVLAGVSMVLGYFVYERIAYFFSQIYQLLYLAPDSINPSTATNDASELFDKGVRYSSLNWIVTAQIISVLSAGAILVFWFFINVRVKK